MSRRRRAQLTASKNGDGHRRSPHGGFVDPILLNRVGELIANQTRTLAQQWASNIGDPRRDIEDECGYPRLSETINPELYVQQWERNPIAARVVECMAKESWQAQYEVYESEDSKEATEFEQAVDDLPKQLLGNGGGPSWYGGASNQGNPIAEALKQVDILSGIGSYGGLLFGFDDVGKGRTLADPVEGFIEENSEPSEGRDSEKEFTGNRRYRLTVNAKPGSRKLLFLRAFAEPLIQVTQYENNQSSPRYGFPVRYLLTLNDPREMHTGIGLPTSSVSVHWTRILHVSDCHHQATSSPIFSPPRMRPCLNDVLACHKILAADGEGFWRNSILKLFFETHPQLGGDVDIDRDGLRDEIEQVMNGLQQWMATSGMSVKAIPPAVVDPTAHLAVHVKAICIKIGVPVPVFEGYEIGEQASENNKQDWGKRLKERQHGYLTPRLIAPFYSRLIAAGVLPVPKQFFVDWPDLNSQDETEKATVFATRVGALAAAVGGGVVPGLMSEMDLLTKEAGYTEEEAEAILENAAQEQEAELVEQQALADEMGFEPAPPPGFGKPEPEEPPQPVKLKEGEKLVQPEPTENEGRDGQKATFNYRQAWLALNAAIGDDEEGRP